MFDSLKTWANRIRTWANQNEGFIALIGTILGTIIAAISLLFMFFPNATTSFLNLEPGLFCKGSVVVMLALGCALICFGYRRHLSEPMILLNKTKAAKLSTWSPNEHWMSDQDVLSVTDSMFGGICTIGTTWADYEFTFEFKTVSRCAGWIVRAKSRDHHVMIQCTDQLHQQVRPHIRTVLSEGDVSRYKLIREIPLPYSLDEWNRAKTVVIGHRIEVWINERLVWSHADLLKDFEQGTVGFRCAPRENGENERAQFRNIQVVKR